MGLDLGMSLVKQRWPRFDRIVDSTPLVIVVEGRLLEDRARRERVDLEDVLAAARASHGLDKLEQIGLAVLERSGGISIVPRQKNPTGGGG
jgi:uncharacterized membrane protein YcaP (DUF421 family)